jgi:hypothetical protein
MPTSIQYEVRCRHLKSDAHWNHTYYTEQEARDRFDDYTRQSEATGSPFTHTLVKIVTNRTEDVLAQY